MVEIHGSAILSALGHKSSARHTHGSVSSVSTSIAKHDSFRARAEALNHFKQMLKES